MSWGFGSGYARSTKVTLNKTVELIDSTGTRSVILIPFVHVGSKEDYEKITYFIDGLKSNGYVTFYESTYIPESLDSASFDLLYRKYRRILGSFKEYTKWTNRHDDWIIQSVSMAKEFMHLSTERDICADVSLAEFVEHFEEKYGREVPLDEYDLTCPLTDLSFCRKPLPKSKWPLISTMGRFRDDRLLESVMNSEYDKIAVLYGGMHTIELEIKLLSRGYHFKYPKKKH